jgi:CRISPR/Cas system-associated exonuclease Cas4 (RecB family)
MDIYIKVKHCLYNLINSNRFKWIISNPNIIAQNSRWIIDPDGYGEAIINNYKVFCKVDFLFPLNNKIYIIDWKTGKQHKQKHKRQLIMYSLWAHKYMNTLVEDIVPKIVYLFPCYNEYTILICDEFVHDFMNLIKYETNHMYQYLTDIDNNIPKSKDNFTKTTNTFYCKYCNYRAIC